MHVHTLHSGMCTVPVLDRFCRESYSDPHATYDVLKRRGMDLVTVTDHDSIDAIEPLRRHPDFFISEEVSCVTPSGTELHVGVYDVDERQHIQMQRRRGDLISLIAYLEEQGLLFSVNHVFSSLTGSRTRSDFALFEQSFPAFESLNGAITPSCNRAAGRLSARLGKAIVAGSDAHTLASLGLTYTDVPHARNKREFLDGIRAARGLACGEPGSYWKLTATVCRLGCEMMRETAWTRLLAPLLLAVPLVTFATHLRDLTFVRKWARRTGAADELSLGAAGPWFGGRFRGRFADPRASKVAL